MSEAEEMRAEGFAELLECDAEELRFRGAMLDAIVDRGMDAKARDKGMLNFLESNQSRIEFLCGCVTDAPRPGEWFEDADRQVHRITVVRRTPSTFRCDCDTQQQTT